MIFSQTKFSLIAVDICVMTKGKKYLAFTETF